jgi:hypothetical protein
MPAEERTEQATPRRRQEARRRGQVARSVDLSSVAVFLAVVLVLKAVSEGALQGAMESVRFRADQPQPHRVLSRARALIRDGLLEPCREGVPARGWRGDGGGSVGEPAAGGCDVHRRAAGSQLGAD